ncbi:MAG: cob(I)yrinic acid a,c-diamide adenosyltransferase [Desulfobacteraceae bacterium]|nr:cob(I)yrinic acid a,c-diamide adenosyltransferase [Desulfobacteraceae bacterium]
MKGYTQIYTGDGKGKTTASLGLALRAAGVGLSVFIAQFLKKGDYSEIKALEQFKNITIEQYGTGKFVRGNLTEEERAKGREGYLRLCEILTKSDYDVVIAEEGNVALLCGLVTEKELLALMDMKPENMELIITGRGATQSMIDCADLVTEMIEIKHYYKKGITARVGIEK